ncbi:MAG: hypothetical protein IE886_07055 [Campylobacterales bacterium]|nr:hypothetical protein [Campylobacterales bacterium]
MKHDHAMHHEQHAGGHAAAYAHTGQGHGGKPFLTATLDELKSRQPGMMALISMAITVTYGYSVSTLFSQAAMPFSGSWPP